MTRFIAIVVFALAGSCAGAPGHSSSSAKRGPVQCGDLTCGPDEACINQCECCGIPAPPEKLRSSTRCEPLPASCLDGSDPSTCRRQIDRPCA